jgi:peptide subunit release factor 1 (eRF1)
VATLQRLIEAGPAVSAWGEGATFDALRDRRVTLLAVDDRLAMPGARCGECGQLWEPITSYCPNCRSGTVETLEDVVEVAIEQALEQDAALEVVRSGPARRLMTGRGAMAALLRW